MLQRADTRPAGGAEAALWESPSSARHDAALPDHTARRERPWQAVAQVLGTLPSPQLKPALLLCHDLALQTSDDGRPQRLFARPWDLPLFDLPGWLLDDWQVEAGTAREAFEAQLFVATTLDLMVLSLRRWRRDPHAFFHDGHLPLEQALRELAEDAWCGLFPPSSPFWAHHRQAHEAACADADTTDPAAARGHWALAALPAIATALWAGRAASIPSLCAFVEPCRVSLQTIDQLAGFRRDLLNGHITATIGRALDAMRVTERSAVRVETALAALLLTGTLDRVLQENTARVATARRVALGMELPRLQAHCDALDTLMQQLRALFGLKPGLDTPAPPPLPGQFFVPAPDVLSNVLDKAQAYLLDDPQCREAWDIQHHSWATAQQIVGRFFGPAIIVDLLGSHGHPVSAQVRQLLETLQSQGFRYWDHVHLLVPDADDLAFAIRLVRHARHPERYRAALQTPLRWMRANQRPDGRIPVWFRDHDSPPALSPASVLYGAECATVEANLLISLIGHDWAGQRDVVEASARHWCRRWRLLGLGACEHYTPLYSLWTAAELVSALRAHSRDEALHETLQQVAREVGDRLRAEAAEPDPSPQDAAFLMLASLRTRALPFDERWVTALFKHQRHDGCWEGEPLYVVPTARHLTTQWFRSRSVTTAFVYHALKHHQAARAGRP